MTAVGETVVSTEQLAVLVGVTADAIRRAVRDGRLVSAGRGRFILADALRSYCGHLRSIASGHGPEAEAADLAKERALLAREQREGQALKNAVTRGELVRADEVVGEWEDVFALIRANMLTVPIVAQQRLAHLTRHDVRVLGEVVRDMLTRSADDDGSADFEVGEEPGAPGAEAA